MRFSFGNFYGELQKRVEVAGVGLTETVYPARVRLPLHAHESLYFSPGSFAVTTVARLAITSGACVSKTPSGV